MTNPVHIAVHPIDDLRRVFTLDRTLDVGGATRVTSADQAPSEPAVAAALAVPGVCEVVVDGAALTVVLDGSSSWETLEPQVRYALEQAAGASAPPASGPAPAAVDDDSLFGLVEDLFRVQINPAVAQHGGRVDLLDVQAGTVVVRMMGGCQGCGMATVTLRQGIEATLKRELPGVHGVKDVTDHAAGANPYFSASKK